MMTDSEQLRVCYEGVVKQNPSDVDAVHYLAVWHMERHSFQQARKYFSHLTSLKPADPDVFVCLSITCAMAEEFEESAVALRSGARLLEKHSDDVRIKFCSALLSEKKRDYLSAMEGYNHTLAECTHLVSIETLNLQGSDSSAGTAGGGSGIPVIATANSTAPADGHPTTTPNNDTDASANSNQGIAGVPVSGANTPLQPNAVQTTTTTSSPVSMKFVKELRGEIMLRMAVLRKETGALDQAMQMCTVIGTEPYSTDAVKANALCLKGLIHEMRAEFPASEVIYRSVLQILAGHSIALERLGRVYLRYRETIPAAVQCFFKSVETNPSNHIAWYLLGRCYMATAQYADACEAYNRAVNLNPNDPQVWCSLGVLYYAFGQYREALGMLSRALKLDHNMADAWYNVGALYDMCDQPEDAQQAYMKARENGLADRFARAGLGLNPLALQSLQYIQGGGDGGVASHQSQRSAQQQQLQQQQLQQQQQNPAYPPGGHHPQITQQQVVQQVAQQQHQQYQTHGHYDGSSFST